MGMILGQFDEEAAQLKLFAPQRPPTPISNLDFEKIFNFAAKFNGKIVRSQKATQKSHWPTSDQRLTIPDLDYERFQIAGHGVFLAQDFIFWNAISLPETGKHMVNILVLHLLAISISLLSTALEALYQEIQFHLYFPEHF